jgi:hypothetical protein
MASLKDEERTLDELEGLTWGEPQFTTRIYRSIMSKTPYPPVQHERHGVRPAAGQRHHAVPLVPLHHRRVVAKRENGKLKLSVFRASTSPGGSKEVPLRAAQENPWSVTCARSLFVR